ncbi:hypothetical protein NL676_034331 [Syzygium grande]|nr:hypothetical protein NL676_034331 [Syzygium grande]
MFQFLLPSALNAMQLLLRKKHLPPRTHHVPSTESRGRGGQRATPEDRHRRWRWTGGASDHRLPKNDPDVPSADSQEPTPAMD